jgi:hypothetical protein
MIMKLERILNPNLSAKKNEGVKFNFEKTNNIDKKSAGDESSSMTPSHVYNFEIQSEYSTKNQTNETEF